MKSNDLFKKIGDLDFLKKVVPEYHFPGIEMPAMEVIDPNETIVGDIRKKL